MEIVATHVVEMTVGTLDLCRCTGNMKVYVRLSDGSYNITRRGFWLCLPRARPETHTAERSATLWSLRVSVQVLLLIIISIDSVVFQILFDT